MNKNILRTEIPEGFVLGSTIDIASLRGEGLFIDLRGNVDCIVGYRRDDQPFDLPYYHPSVASHDKDGKSSYRFVSLRHGTLVKSGFLHQSEYYRPLNDRRLALPRGADNYFGVITLENRKEDVDMTRQLFGGTAEEITEVAGALAHLIGRGYQMARLPRITFSKTRQNQCDISGCLIPREFPYLAFEESQYAWGHVSLHGFYRILSLLCSAKSSNPIRNALIDSGISEKLLDALIANDNVVGAPIPFPDYF